MRLGAYFYPLTTQCVVRNARTKKQGCELINEVYLASHAKPIIGSQNLPHIYCLGDKVSTSWDDEDAGAMQKQVDLAKKYGIDFFIFDSYMGLRDGKFVQEMEKPLDEMFIGKGIGKDMHFGLMVIPESPRCILPVSPGVSEQNREYDMDLRNAQEIVELCASKYWSQENYLRIENKPYISIYMSQLSESKRKRKYIQSLISEIRSYSQSKYDIDPYIVGVASTLEAGSFFENAGVNALTGYANLPNFKDKENVLQNYEDQLLYQYSMWDEFREKLHIPFVPSAVTGWDATPRCKPGNTFEDVRGVYPFTPIVLNSSPELFGIMLEKALNFTRENVPKNEEYGIICAWNEVSESMALLPEICNNKIDFSYLEVVKGVSSLK